MLERTTVFDPDRRQMKVLSSRLIGKLEPGQTDLSQMVETDKFYSRNKKKAATDVVQSLDGLTDTRLSECVTYPLDVVLLVVVLAAGRVEETLTGLLPLGTVRALLRHTALLPNIGACGYQICIGR